MKTIHPPENFWKLNRAPSQLRHGSVEVQHYAFCRDDSLAFAGVDKIDKIDARAAWTIVRHWCRWRHWYDHLPWNQRRHYPAKLRPQEIVTISLHPVGEPSATQWYRVPITLGKNGIN